MSNEATPFEDKEPKLAVLLKAPAYADRFKQVLGERAPQFVSSLISIGNTMPDVDPKSIIGSAMIAATLDLPIDKNLGFAWIVPYRKGDRKYGSFQLGAKGLTQLALRSGQYARLNAMPINKEVFAGYDEVGEPVLDFDNYDPDKEVYGYFFGFKLINGFVKKAVWTKAKILEHARRYSQSFRAESDIWVKNFDEMATKTVLANTLRRFGPLSVQMQTALSSDTKIFTDVDAEPITPEIEDSVESPKENPEKKLADEKNLTKLKNEAEAAAKEKDEKAKAAKAQALKQKADDEKAEADMGLAPQKEKPSETKPEPKAETKPEPAKETPKPKKQPEKEPLEKGQATSMEKTATEPANVIDAQKELGAATQEKQLSEKQALCKKVLTEELKYTWEQVRGWIVFSKMHMNPIPNSWAEIPEKAAEQFATMKAAVDAGVKRYLASAGK